MTQTPAPPAPGSAGHLGHDVRRGEGFATVAAKENRRPLLDLQRRLVDVQVSVEWAAVCRDIGNFTASMD